MDLFPDADLDASGALAAALDTALDLPAPPPPAEGLALDLPAPPPPAEGLALDDLALEGAPLPALPATGGQRGMDLPGMDLPAPGTGADMTQGVPGGAKGEDGPAGAVPPAADRGEVPGVPVEGPAGAGDLGPGAPAGEAGAGADPTGANHWFGPDAGPLGEAEGTPGDGPLPDGFDWSGGENGPADKNPAGMDRGGMGPAGPGAAPDVPDAGGADPFAPDGDALDVCATGQTGTTVGKGLAGSPDNPWRPEHQWLGTVHGGTIDLGDEATMTVTRTDGTPHDPKGSETNPWGPGEKHLWETYGGTYKDGGTTMNMDPDVAGEENAGKRVTTVSPDGKTVDITDSKLFDGKSDGPVFDTTAGSKEDPVGTVRSESGLGIALGLDRAEKWFDPGTEEGRKHRADIENGNADFEIAPPPPPPAADDPGESHFGKDRNDPPPPPSEKEAAAADKAVSGSGEGGASTARTVEDDPAFADTGAVAGPIAGAGDPVTTDDGGGILADPAAFDFSGFARPDPLAPYVQPTGEDDGTEAGFIAPEPAPIDVDPEHGVGILPDAGSTDALERALQDPRRAPAA